MRKSVDQSDRRIQAHMDQRAHIQQQTDVPGVQASGEFTRGHMGAHQRRLEVVGPTCQSADHYGRPSGPYLHRPPASAGSFLLVSLSQFWLPRIVQASAQRPLSPPYKYERGKEMRQRRQDKQEHSSHFSLEQFYGLWSLHEVVVGSLDILQRIGMGSILVSASRP